MEKRGSVLILDVFYGRLSRFQLTLYKLQISHHANLKYSIEVNIQNYTIVYHKRWDFV